MRGAFDVQVNENYKFNYSKNNKIITSDSSFVSKWILYLKRRKFIIL